ncbi:MAG TPA: ABC transporter permease [Williamwhitmania sp.]|nr:ABC transporter permease [Williamwhitmania sp.]
MKSNLKASIRSIYKHKVSSAINVAGLAVGFSAFILISLFVQYEYSWDKHNVNYDRIYRVQRTYVKAVAAMDGNNISPHTHGITKKLLEAQCPEIEKVLITEYAGGRYLSPSPSKQIYDNEGIIMEPSVFEIFTYHFIKGDSSTALKEPNSIVLSSTLAGKLFPDGDAMGKTVLIEKQIGMKVTGVYKDLPRNSEVRPSYIISLSTIEQMRNVKDSWSGNVLTYVLLRSNKDLARVNAKIWDLYKDYKGHEEEKVSLCPLSMLYLDFNGQDDYLIVLFLYRLIGIFILLLACFNYINLATAHASTRTKEIAVKKVCGSSRFALIQQILTEAAIIALIAVMLSFLIVENFLPVFNRIVSKNMEFSIAGNWPFALQIVLIAIVVGLASGAYPAFFLATRKIVYLLKGNLFKTKKEAFGPKRILIILQFSISLFLIIITMAFSEQIKYLLNKNLGFNKENILFAKFSVNAKNVRFDDLRDRILAHPEFQNGCFCEHIPFVTFGGGNINWEGCLPGESVNVRFNGVSYDFLSNFGMTIVAGRGFSRDFPSDTVNGCIINETAWRSFGWKDPIGKRLDNNRLEVVGVVKDYNYKDMHNGIEPAILVLQSEPRSGDWSFAFRVTKGDMSQAKKIIQEEFENYFPNSVFEFGELDEAFKHENVLQVYNSVDNTLLFFTILNVFLAIIGLLGLVSFTIMRKTKEIGIRKISGSSDMSIFTMLTKEYLSLIVYAMIISWPAAYAMYAIIPGANKQPINFSVYIIASLTIMVIVVLTSCYQTIKVSRANPIDALRYE